MSDKWEFYLAAMRDKPASVFVDTGIAQEAPKEGYRVRLVVLVKQKHPRVDGLTSKEEADRLWSLEDILVKAVTDWGGIFVGRITTDGRRDFFFYAPSASGFDAVVSRAVEPLAYEFETSEDSDGGWDGYFNFLYPTPLDWQRIMNQHVRENLKRNGDDLSKPRRVFHWLYFATAIDRDRCAPIAREKGFGAIILSEIEQSDKEHPFGLQLHRIDSVAPADIDDVTIELFTLAGEHSGHYDGWETQIVKAGEEPTDDSPKCE